MNIMGKKLLLGLLGVFLLCHPTPAVETEPPKVEKEIFAKGEEKAPEKKDTIPLEEMVVTATKTPKTLWNVPAAVSVVTEKDLERKNYMKLNEALELLPGTSAFSSRRLAEPFPGVNLRGFHGHMRTLVLVNGQPISPFLYNAALVHWSAVPPDVVERVEVVRGPFSALYGGDAVGGVINIITKCPEKLGLLVRGGYGSEETYKFHAGVHNKFFDRVTVYLSYDKRLTDSYVSDYAVLQPADPGPGATPVFGARLKPWSTGGPSFYVGDLGQFFYDENTLNLTVKWDITENSYLRLNALYSWYLMDPFNNHTYLRDPLGKPVYSGFVTTFPATRIPFYLDLSPSDFVNYKVEHATGVYAAEYYNKINDKLNFKVTAGVTNFLKDRFYVPIAYASIGGGLGLIMEAPSNIFNTEVQANYWLLPKFLLTGGFNYRYDWGHYNTYLADNWRERHSRYSFIRSLRPKSNRYGLYFQGEIHLLDNLVIYPGIRFDWWNSQAIAEAGKKKERHYSEDNSISPKLALLYHPWKNTTLRLSGGKAFRVPNFFELYQIWRSGGQEYRPNPFLKPEITWGWEAGLEQRLFDNRTKIGLTYFEHYTSDYIDSRLYKIGTTRYMQRDNIGEVQARGVEVELRQKINKYLDFFANYTFINAEITKFKGYPEYVGKVPRYVPKNMFNAGLDFHYNRFKAAITTHYMSRMFYNNLNDTVDWNVYGVLDRFNFITDINLAFDLTKNINASVTVNDIFNNTNYYQYARQAGRTVLGVVSVKF